MQLAEYILVCVLACACVSVSVAKLTAQRKHTTDNAPGERVSVGQCCFGTDNGDYKYCRSRTSYESFVSLYRVYSVFNDNILIWICDV
jgi:hypothetical protein